MIFDTNVMEKMEEVGNKMASFSHMMLMYYLAICKNTKIASKGTRFNTYVS